MANPAPNLKNLTPFEKGYNPKRNYKGRPKGKTIKEMVREWLDEHPKDRDEFIKHFVKNNRDLTWQMLEGRPPQDFTSAGERINPIPIINVHTDDSDIKDNGNVQEDKDSAGRDFSEQDS